MYYRLWSKLEEGLERVRDFGGHLLEIENSVYSIRKEKNCKDNLILTLVHWKIAKQFHFDNDVILRVVKIYSPLHLRTNSLITTRHRIDSRRFMTFHLPLYCVLLYKLYRSIGLPQAVLYICVIVGKTKLVFKTSFPAYN